MAIYNDNDGDEFESLVQEAIFVSTPHRELIARWRIYNEITA